MSEKKLRKRLTPLIQSLRGGRCSLGTPLIQSLRGERCSLGTPLIQSLRGGLCSLVCRRAARLLHHALHRSRENAKNKLYHKKNKQSISIARKARYALNKPKTDTREVYVKRMKKRITSKPTLKRELLRAFRSCCNPLAEKIKPSKLANAVLNISTRKLLNRVLKARKQSVEVYQISYCTANVLSLLWTTVVDV